jgi:hypothetical protein
VQHFLRSAPLLCFLALGCGAPGAGAAPAGGDGPLGAAQEPIYNGTPDTTHPAVVAVLSMTSECSATIIQVTGTTAYALTAAHCCTPSDHPLQALMGDDYTAPTATLPVIAYEADPDYDGQIHDFCMLQLAGASASTPVIPVMTPANDDLASGSVVEFIGYGATQTNPNNTVRESFTGPLDGVTQWTLEYSQTLGGPCAGDSGGPSLSTVNGVQVVSGVTSYGDVACTMFGVSGRVSADYASFIEAYLDDQPIQPTCAQCSEAATGAGVCETAANACQNDMVCDALLTCLDACADGDTACEQTCATQNAGGVTLYEDVTTCICTQGCVAECGSMPGCGGQGGGQGGGAPTSGATTTGSGSETSGGSGTGFSSGSGTGGDSASSGPSSAGGCAFAPGGEGPVATGGAFLGLLAALRTARRRRRPAA